MEVLPDGVVQVQLAGSVREKLRAEAEARKTVAKSLEQDAMRDLAALEDLVCLLYTSHTKKKTVMESFSMTGIHSLSYRM